MLALEEHPVVRIYMERMSAWLQLMNQTAFPLLRLQMVDHAM